MKVLGCLHLPLYLRSINSAYFVLFSKLIKYLAFQFCDGISFGFIVFSLTS